MYLHQPSCTLAHIDLGTTPEELKVMAGSPQGVSRLDFWGCSSYETTHVHFVPPARSRRGYEYGLIALSNANSIRSEVALAGSQLLRILSGCRPAESANRANASLPPLLIWACLGESVLTVHCAVRDRNTSEVLLVEDRFPTSDFAHKPCFSADDTASTSFLSIERWKMLSEPCLAFTGRPLTEGRVEAFEWRGALIHSLDVLLEQLSVDYAVQVGDWPTYDDQSVLRISSAKERLAAMALYLLELTQHEIRRRRRQLKCRLKKLNRRIEASMVDVFTDSMLENCNLMSTLARYIHGEGVPLDTKLRKLVARSTILLRKYCELRSAFLFQREATVLNQRMPFTDCSVT